MHKIVSGSNDRTVKVHVGLGHGSASFPDQYFGSLLTLIYIVCNNVTMLVHELNNLHVVLGQQICCQEGVF